MAHVSNLRLSVDVVPITTLKDTLDYCNPRHCSVQRVGGFLYVMGAIRNGRVGNRLPVVGVLDIIRKQWRWIEYEGLMMEQPRTFVFGDGLYTYCASDWSGNRKGKLSRFDLALEEWSNCVTTGIWPGGRRGCTGDYVEKWQRFVVHGGHYGPIYHNTVLMLKMPECRWIKPEVKGKRPEGRFQHGSCVHQGRIYYLGGLTYYSFCSDGMFILELSEKDEVIWSSIRSRAIMDLKLNSPLILSLDGKVLICGGYSEDQYHDFTLFDPTTQTVEQVELPQESRDLVGYGGASFNIEEGRSFGVFGGKEDLYSFVLVTRI